MATMDTRTIKSSRDDHDDDNEVVNGAPQQDQEEHGLELRAFLSGHADDEDGDDHNKDNNKDNNGIHSNGGQHAHPKHSHRAGLFLQKVLDTLIPPSPLVHGQPVPTYDDDGDDDDDDDEQDDDTEYPYNQRHKRQHDAGLHVVAHSHSSTSTHAAGASNAQVAVNIFISFVGAGMLGIPYAFRQSGWLLGSVVLALVSSLNVYCMLLLVQCRSYFETHYGVTDIQGYGDLGRHILGPHGEIFVNVCLVISQVGFATAYIIFISANITTLLPTISRATVCFGCIPILALLVQARHMKTLSPFSLLADVANLFGLSAVLIQDFEYYTHSDTIHAVQYTGILYVTSIALYSLEGVGLILPLESSCADRRQFPKLLVQVIAGITLVMIFFGSFGYIAFGDATVAPITLNLQGEWATFVKCALCLALYLTYPIMMFPVSDVLETWFGIARTTSSTRSDTSNGHGHGQATDKPQPLHDMTTTTTTTTTTTSHGFTLASVVLRASVVACSASIAYAVPDFGKFLGLVGASICTILGFILPCFFHLRVFRGQLKYLELLMDVGLIVLGVAFGILGTMESIQKLVEG